MVIDQIIHIWLRYILIPIRKRLLRHHWGAVLIIGGRPSLRESIRYRTLVLKWSQPKSERTFLYSVDGTIDKVFNADGTELLPSGRSL